MAKKTEITSGINTALADGSGIQASEHRGVLHGNTTSIVDNIYASPVQESDTTVTKTITTSNANFSYTANFTKTGRKIRLLCTFENISGGTLTGSNTIFTLQDTEYKSELQITKAKCTKNNFSGDDNFLVSVSDVTFSARQTILNGESYTADFTYNALD